MYDVPKPKKFAQDIPAEQLKAMQPIDKLVQYVIPKLIDKMNMLSWRVDKLEHETSEALSSMYKSLAAAEPAAMEKATVEDIYKAINEIHEWQHAVDTNMSICMDALSSKKRAPQRKKVADKPSDTTPTPAYVSDAAYSMYDPDLDDWVPYEFDGIKITASVADAALAGELENVDIVKFVKALTPEVLAALRKRFPG